MNWYQKLRSWLVKPTETQTKKKTPVATHYRSKNGNTFENNNGYSNSYIADYGCTPLFFDGNTYTEIDATESTASTFGGGDFGGGGAGGFWSFSCSSSSSSSNDSSSGSSCSSDSGSSCSSSCSSCGGD